MSRMIGNKFIVEHEKPDFCQLCGRLAELRPYGANNERICSVCGDKNPEVTKQKIAERIKEAELVVDNSRGGLNWN